MERRAALAGPPRPRSVEVLDELVVEVVEVRSGLGHPSGSGRECTLALTHLVRR